MRSFSPDGSCPPATPGRRGGTGRSRQCTGRPGHDDDDDDDDDDEEEEEEKDEDGQDGELEGDGDFNRNFSYIAIIFDAVFPEVSH